MSRSSNGGATWSPIHELAHVSLNAFALALDGSVLAATSGGLAQSLDDGSSWNFIDDEPIYSTLPAGANRPPNLITYRLIELDDGRTLAGTLDQGIWEQKPENHWRHLGLGETTIYSLVTTPSGALLAGTKAHHIYRSEDGGQSWTSVSDGLPDDYVHSLVLHPDGTIFAGTGKGLAFSNNDGITWHPYADAIRNHRIFSVTPLQDGRLLAGSYTQLWVGQDDVWELIDPGLTPDESWSVRFLDCETILAGTKAGPMLSQDRGETWEATESTSTVYDICQTSTGEVIVASEDGVLQHPGWESVGGLGQAVWVVSEVGPNILLAGTFDQSLHRYDGAEWTRLADAPKYGQIYSILCTQSGRTVMTTGGIVDGEKSGGIFWSDDAGLRWHTAWTGKSVYDVAEASDGTLYAGAQRCRILISRDDGATWSAAPPAIDHDAKTYSLSIDRHDRLFLGAGEKLFRSDDGADSWILLDDGLDGVSVFGVTNEVDSTMCAATNCGLYLSTDKGDSWVPSPRSNAVGSGPELSKALRT